MDKNTVLSLSPDKDALASREAILRHGGMRVVSVSSPVEARFEIEMGRCGVFLICYRLQQRDADELTNLFKRFCPYGQIIFVSNYMEGAKAPAEADIAIPESFGPELILNALKRRESNPSAAA
jgi:DNA-binding NtrC family response regulator